MLEFLVAAICISGFSGCAESSSAYYRHNKSLQELSQAINEKAQKISKNKQWIVYAATPIYAAASNQPAKIVLYEGAVMSLDLKKSSVSVVWTY